MSGFRIGEIVLPELVALKLKSLLKGYPRSLLKPDVERLLDVYKSSCQIHHNHILPVANGIETSKQSIPPSRLPKMLMDYGEREVMAYLACQFPFAYGPIQRVFKEIALRIPEFKPQSILDFGTGPGTAILYSSLACCLSSYQLVRSANEYWKGSLTRITGIDVSEAMLVTAKKMLVEASHQARLEFKRYLPLKATSKSDMTVSAFVLSELPDDGVRKMSVDSLWKQTGEIMVLIDRGTPEGFRVLAEARKQILCGAGYLDDAGETVARPRLTEALHVVSPCSHEKKCPMVGSWCHFSQRVQLSNFQMETHPMAKGFEDQKYSYLVLRRGERPGKGLEPDEQKAELSEAELSFHWPRLIRRPLKRGGHVINDVCDSDSTFKRIIVPKSQGNKVYTEARKAKWGDLWPHSPKNPARVIPTMAVKPGKKRH